MFTNLKQIRWSENVRKILKMFTNVIVFTKLKKTWIWKNKKKENWKEKK